MAKRNITVRVFGDPAAIAAAMDDARLRCVERELDKHPDGERSRMIDMIAARYGAP